MWFVTGTCRCQPAWGCASSAHTHAGMVYKQRRPGCAVVCRSGATCAEGNGGSYTHGSAAMLPAKHQSADDWDELDMEYHLSSSGSQGPSTPGADDRRSASNVSDEEGAGRHSYMVPETQRSHQSQAIRQHPLGFASEQHGSEQQAQASQHVAETQSRLHRTQRGQPREARRQSASSHQPGNRTQILAQDTEHLLRQPPQQPIDGDCTLKTRWAEAGGAAAAAAEQGLSRRDGQERRSRRGWRKAGGEDEAGSGAFDNAARTVQMGATGMHWRAQRVGGHGASRHAGAWSADDSSGWFEGQKPSDRGDGDRSRVQRRPGGSDSRQDRVGMTAVRPLQDRRDDTEATRRQQWAQEGGIADQGGAAHEHSMDPAQWLETKDRRLTYLIGACTSVGQLLQLWEQRRSHFTHMHLVATTHRLAKVHRKHDGNMPRKVSNSGGLAMAAAVQDLLQWLDAGFAYYLDLGKYTAREVCMTVWAWGKLGHQPSREAWGSISAALCPPREVGAGLEGGMEQRQGGMAANTGGSVPGAMGVTAWPGAAEMSRSTSSRQQQQQQQEQQSSSVGRPGVAAEMSITPGLLHSASPQGLAMLAWGLSQLRCPDDCENVWGALEEAVQFRLAAPKIVASIQHSAASPQPREAHMQPRDLSNIVWAFATSGRHSVRLFSDVANAMAPCTADMTPQDLANTAWAYAVVGHPYRPLFDAIAEAAPRILHAFTPQGLSNLLWAFARVQVAAPELFHSAARVAVGRLRQYEPGHLSMTAWALARSGMHHPQLLFAISSSVRGDMQAFKSKEIVNVLWALASADLHNDLLFTLAPPVLLARMKQDDMSWQDIAQALWSLAVADQYHAAFFAAACSTCVDRWSSQDLAASPTALDLVLLSLATCGHYCPELMQLAAGALHGCQAAPHGRHGAPEQHGATGQQGQGSPGASVHARKAVGEFALPEPIQMQQADADMAVQLQTYGRKRGWQAPTAVEPLAANGANTAGVSQDGKHRQCNWDGSSAVLGHGAGTASRLLLRPALAASMLASMARLNHVSEAACAGVAREITRALRICPEEVPMAAVANCLWAFAVLDYQDLHFVEAAAQHVSTLHRQGPRSMHLMAAAGVQPQEQRGQEGVGPDVGMQLLTDQLRLESSRLTSGSDSGWGSIVQQPGLVEQDLRQHQQLDKMDQPLQQPLQQPQDEQQEQGDRALMRHLQPGAWALQRVGLGWNNDLLRLREAMQLLQASLWLQDLRCPKAKAAAARFPQALIQPAAAAWRKAAKGQSTVSGLQQQVYAFLRQHMNLEPQLETRTADGMFSIDITVQWRGQAVALEVNGPLHYAVNQPSTFSALAITPASGLHADGSALASHVVAGKKAADPHAKAGITVVVPCVPVPRVLGYKRLRDRFLEARGVAVANLSWLEWLEAAKASDTARAYLAALMDEAVQQHRSTQHHGGGR